MIEIAKITKIDDQRHIALLDTSSISFMQGLNLNYCASLSRYFSDELDAQIFKKNTEQPFTYIYTYSIISIWKKISF